MLIIQDEHHRMILVYELEPSISDAGPRTLVIESRSWSLQLFDYPAGWQRMKSEELLALRESRDGMVS